MKSNYFKQLLKDANNIVWAILGFVWNKLRFSDFFSAFFLFCSTANQRNTFVDTKRFFNFNNFLEEMVHYLKNSARVPIFWATTVYVYIVLRCLKELWTDFDF